MDMKILPMYKIAVLLSAVFLFFGTIFLAGKELKKIALNTKLTQSSPAPTPLPAPSSSPTSKPTPTSHPLVGFCINVPILLYHHIEPQENINGDGHKNLAVNTEYFDKQMAYLVSKGYKTLSMDELATALNTKQKLPGKNIVITMDDGYDDIYNFAFPIIKKYGVKVNLMIPTGLLGVSGYMNWNQIKEMVGSGLAFAYDHTWSHTALAGKSTEKITYEIMTAKKQLEENLGRPVNIFTYPYGSENNQVVSILKSNGFVAAASTLPGHVQCDSFIMSLHRNRVGSLPLSSYGI